MLRIILFLLISINTFNGFSQCIEKYKIQTIDTTSLKDFFIIKVINKKGDTKKIFSKKKDSTETKSIKVGSKYSLKLEEFNLMIDDSDEIQIRGKHAIYVDSVEILGENEKAYKTKCLIGIVHINCQ